LNRAVTRVDTTVVDRGLLVRYRVMAFTTATLLIILVFVGIPLQLAAGRPEVVNVVGTIHGFLYLVYLFVAFQLTRKLGIPKWQMALVLVAGTVPFCAFVAERKMTKRFEARGPQAGSTQAKTVGASPTGHAARVRQRWFSPRALLLHLEVLIIAPGCAVAGWWQATRALAGNGLSWVYSIEWPIFALLAIAGWWFLIHEDPEAYRARKRGSPPAAEARATDVGASASVTTTIAAEEAITVETTTARLAKVLVVLVGTEFVLGIIALVFVPAGRPSGLLPAKSVAIYLAHAVLGLPLVFGAVALLTRVRRSTRLSRLSGWIGAGGVAIAGIGGLLTVAHPLRLAGLACMLVGTLVAGFGYLIPTFEKLS
jgi:integral membrane protein